MSENHRLQKDNTAPQPLILMACGASGGHVFPALSVAHELRESGCRCIFVGGGASFKKWVEQEGFESIMLPVAPFNVRNPLRKVYAVFTLILAIFRALLLVIRLRPSVVFGTGGYATVAVVLAGRLCGVPTMLHEQNAVPGRANRVLFRHVDKIALTFRFLPGVIPPKLENKVKLSGYPVRPAVRAQAQQLKRTSADKQLHILVAGGSLGARFLSDVVPQAIVALNNSGVPCTVTQQARPEDVERVREVYISAGIAHEVRAFFDDFPQRMTQAHVAVCRAGAGLIFENMALELPAIYIPHELADMHQVRNAEEAEKLGVSVTLRQGSQSAEQLAALLQELFHTPAKQTAMRTAAKENKNLDTARKLADDILLLAKMDVMMQAEEAPALRQDAA